MNTGERIRNVRENKGIFQQELADAIDLNVSVLNRIEKGTRPIRDDELVKIANTLSVSSDYLLGISNNYLLDDKFDLSSLPSTTANLPADERDLLKMYRSLPTSSKSVVRMMIKGLYDSIGVNGKNSNESLSD